jgi:hypothetical protein
MMSGLPEVDNDDLKSILSIQTVFISSLASLAALTVAQVYVMCTEPPTGR